MCCIKSHFGIFFSFDCGGAVMRAGLLISTTAILVWTGSAPAQVDPLLLSDIGSVVVTAPSTPPSKPDIFGTVALDAGVTPYGARWRRVSAADAGDPRIRALGMVVSHASLDPIARLTSVQEEVARRVRWRSDLETYKVSDYWAQAGETLSRGEGDSEDIAVLKMQVLKAAGFPSRDIYLSVGRNSERGADTLLLVRVGSMFYSLDDREPQPRPAMTRREFTPMFTLGKNSAWIHGKRFSAQISARSRRTSLARAPVR
jgi:predicted transglutaminase-like cysteine proteinase